MFFPWFWFSSLFFLFALVLLFFCFFVKPYILCVVGLIKLDSIRHGVKGVVRAYDALQLSRCCACATTHNLFSSRDQHRQYYETGLCYHCFAALERDDEHALTRCIALAEDATKLGKLLVLLTKWNPARGGMMVPADRIDAWNNITIIDMRSWIFWFGNAP